jgi:transcriptional repressor NrdR
VIKRDGEQESFDLSKLLRGFVTACEKTGISITQLEAIVDDIEAELQQRAVRDVSSKELGEAVLRHLQALSEVAYVRFASVYRQFQGIRDFVEELDHLQEATGLDPLTFRQDKGKQDLLQLPSESFDIVEVVSGQDA